MAVTVASLQAVLDLNKTKFDKGIKDADRGFGGLAKSIEKTAKGVALGGLAILGAGIAGLTVGLKKSVDLAREQNRVERQLNAVLQSTGFAAGLTAQQLTTMASGLQKVTNFGDEAIIGAENLLLTFTNIGQDAFPRALESILDVSVAMGQDLKSSTIQIGKALNNPIEGLAALRRVGIQFTEQQEEQIKAMVEAGDVAGAQGIILDELGRQFGGSAKAAVEPTTQLKNLLGDLGETVGNVVIPALDDLAEKITPLVEGIITKVQEVGPTFADMFKALTEGDGPRALHDFQMGLLQLGFSPDQVEKLSEAGTRISEAFGTLEESGQRIANLFGGGEGGLNFVLEQFVVLIEDIADLSEDIATIGEAFQQGGFFAGLGAIGQTQFEFAPGDIGIGDNFQVGASSQFGQGGPITTQNTTVEIPISIGDRSFGQIIAEIIGGQVSSVQRTGGF